MPLKVNVGVSRKMGLPGYSSAGASCNVEVELDGGLLRHDPGAFRGQVRGAFAAARRAVDGELARLRARLVTAPGATVPPPAGDAPTHGERSGDPPARPCTGNQARAIRALALDRGFDLESMLLARYGAACPEALSVAQAGALIGSLRSAVER